MATIHDEALKGALNKTRIARYRASGGASFDIDELDIRGRTALASAALKGHINVVKALVEEHADVNKASRGSRTALWYAASGTMPTKTRFEIINYLLDHDAEIDEPSDDGNTPLMKVIIEFKDPKVISLLVDRGANINIRNSANKTAKQLGDQTKDPQVIEALLPKDERGGSTGAFVQLIVSFLLFVVAWMNSDLVTGLVKGVAEQLYKITGEERPEIADVCFPIFSPYPMHLIDINVCFCWLTRCTSF
jgi:Ankyrin repeats (3 copies)/Ankyrin repeat